MSQGTDASVGESGEGTIEPEVAEKFASAFVPMWQLEDASFCAGGAYSNEDVRVLAAGAVVVGTVVVG